MRILNLNEINIINKRDFIPFLNYMNSRGWPTTKISGVRIMSETKENLKGANGKTLVKDGERYVILSEDIINDEIQRTRILYHELGHYLLGLKNSSPQTIRKINEQIVYTRRENLDVLQEEALVYLEGLKLIEEYLVEKFSIGMTQNIKDIIMPKYKGVQVPKISGNYTFETTFANKYGIFETLCDKLVTKAYGNLGNTIKAGLDEKIFIGLFEKYDKVELMKILGNLGKIKNAIYSYAGYESSREGYTPEEVHKLLNETNEMIDNIQLKEVQQNNNSGR